MSEVRLVVAILVPAIFTLILKDFFDLFMTNRYEGKVKQYFGMVMYNGRHKYFDSNIHFFHVLFDNQIFFGCFVYKEDN